MPPGRSLDATLPRFQADIVLRYATLNVNVFLLKNDITNW